MWEIHGGGLASVSRLGFVPAEIYDKATVLTKAIVFCRRIKIFSGIKALIVSAFFFYRCRFLLFVVV